jgi:hypothetical protein
MRMSLLATTQSPLRAGGRQGFMSSALGASAARLAGRASVTAAGGRAASMALGPEHQWTGVTVGPSQTSSSSPRSPVRRAASAAWQ